MAAQPALELTNAEHEDLVDAILIEAAQHKARLPGSPRLASPQSSPLAALARLDHTWVDRAACSSATPEEADQLTDSRSQAEGAEVIETYCSRCPVLEQCLSDARALRGWGVAGGVVLVDGVLAPEERPAGAQQATVEPVVNLEVVPAIEDDHTEPAPAISPVVEVATTGEISDHAARRRSGQRAQPRRLSRRRRQARVRA